MDPRGAGGSRGQAGCGRTVGGGVSLPALLTQRLITAALLLGCASSLPTGGRTCRCRPGDRCWPSASEWAGLDRALGGNLAKPALTVAACLQPERPNTSTCLEQYANTTSDPFYIESFAGGLENSGWIGAWNATPSAYAAEVESAEHVAAAVDFARAHGLRFVVKGTGHDYTGRSQGPEESLLLWTRKLNSITFHQFSSTCSPGQAQIPAVTAGAGVRWGEVYSAAAAQKPQAQYVQGGGCTSVGVVGWNLGGGYGLFSKEFGAGASNLLGAVVVTGDGVIRNVSRCENSDLFWAMKGGGHGFGVVVSITMRTHVMPTLATMVNLEVSVNDAGTAEDRKLLYQKVLELYETSLTTQRWGMGIIFSRTGGVSFSGFKAHSYNVTEPLEATPLASKPWGSFMEWVKTYTNQNGSAVFKLTEAIPGGFLSFPMVWMFDGRDMRIGDPFLLKRCAPLLPCVLVQKLFKTQLVYSNHAGWAGSFFNAGDQAEIYSYYTQYASRFLTEDHFFKDKAAGAEKLYSISRIGSAFIHTNKALGDASAWAKQELVDSPIHESMLRSFGLLISRSSFNHYDLRIPGHLQGRKKPGDLTPCCSECNNNTQVQQCMQTLQSSMQQSFQAFREATPGAGVYYAEMDFFEPDWQEAVWGLKNYQRLARIKAKYDPGGIFFCHKCVGSEGWSADGMCKLH